MLSGTSEGGAGPGFTSNSDCVTIHANTQLLWWAYLRWGALAAVLGVVIMIGMLLDRQGWADALASLFFPAAGALLLGSVTALTWRLWSGRVRYVLDADNLTAWRGKRHRASVPISRIAWVDFNQHPEPIELALTHWFDYDTPLPRLVVTLNTTKNPWDPTNAAAKSLPTILLAGDDQTRALETLRLRLHLREGT